MFVVWGQDCKKYVNVGPPPTKDAQVSVMVRLVKLKIIPRMSRATMVLIYHVSWPKLTMKYYTLSSLK